MNPLEGSMPTIFKARVILAKVTDGSQLAAPTTHPVFVYISDFEHKVSFDLSLADTLKWRC
jgi:hypothetical protein